MKNAAFKKQFKYIKENYIHIKKGKTIYENTKLANKEFLNFKIDILKFIAILVSPVIILDLFLIYLFPESGDIPLLVICLILLTFIGFILTTAICDSLIKTEKPKVPKSKLEKIKKDLNSIDHPFIDFFKENIKPYAYHELHQYLNLNKVNFTEIFIFYLKKLNSEEFLYNEKYIFDLLKNEKYINISGNLLKTLADFYIELYKNSYLTSNDINNRIHYFYKFNAKDKDIPDYNFKLFKDRILNDTEMLDLENDIFKENITLKKEKHISF
tara:strand:+ start:11587 stop:12396 length:810 start_codon:yes stop_codon:yes gene_type:complete